MPQPESLSHSEESTEPDGHCSATGGSARSQAADLDERTWRPRPILGGFVRVVAVVGPFIVTYVSIRLAMRVVPRPVNHLGSLLEPQALRSSSATSRGPRWQSRAIRLQRLIRWSARAPNRRPLRPFSRVDPAARTRPSRLLRPPLK
jgi:hypothetical protein